LGARLPFRPKIDRGFFSQAFTRAAGCRRAPGEGSRRRRHPSYGASPTGHGWNLLYGPAGYTQEGTMSKMRALDIPIKLSE